MPSKRAHVTGGTAGEHVSYTRHHDHRRCHYQCLSRLRHALVPPVGRARVRPGRTLPRCLQPVLRWSNEHARISLCFILLACSSSIALQCPSWPVHPTCATLTRGLVQPSLRPFEARLAYTTRGTQSSRKGHMRSLAGTPTCFSRKPQFQISLA